MRRRLRIDADEPSGGGNVTRPHPRPLPKGEGAAPGCVRRLMNAIGKRKRGSAPFALPLGEGGGEGEWTRQARSSVRLSEDDSLHGIRLEPRYTLTPSTECLRPAPETRRPQISSSPKLEAAPGNAPKGRCYQRSVTGPHVAPDSRRLGGRFLCGRDPVDHERLAARWPRYASSTGPRSRNDQSGRTST